MLLWWQIFLVGCLGAVAPEVIRAYKHREVYKKEAVNLKQYGVLYFLISVVFFLLGGVVAIVLDAATYYAAFYVGVAAPVIVSAIGASPPSTPAPVVDPGKPAPPKGGRRLGFGGPALPPGTFSGLREYLGLLFA